MSKRALLRICAVLTLCLLALLFLRLHSASGQTPHGGDPISRGGSLVQAWCLQCHSIGPLSGSAPAERDFKAIARMPSTTELSLRVFLQSSHREMPNFVIKGHDLDDIVAYILSLRKE